MIITLCDCNWGIPNVEKLPPHWHNIHWTLRRKNDGKILRYSSINFIEQPDYEILEKEEIIVLIINWKEIVRATNS